MSNAATGMFGRLRNYWFGLGPNRNDDIALIARIFRTYFKQYRTTYAIIFVLIFATAAATGAAAYLVQDVVNDIFVNSRSELIIPLFIGVMAAFLIRGFASYFQAVLSSRISNAMVADVQQRIYKHTIRQRNAFFTRHSSDELLMRFNQGAAGFSTIMSNVLVNGSRDAATLVALLGVMVVQDPVLMLTSALAAPIIFYGIGLILGRMKNVAERQLAGHSKLNKNVRELVQGITIVKSYNMEDVLVAKNADVVKDLRKQKNRIAMLAAAPLPLLDAVGGAAIGLAILYAGFRTTGGAYDIGAFMSFITALLLAADPARRLSRIRVNLKAPLVAVRMIYELLDDDQSEQSTGVKLALQGNSATSPEDEDQAARPVASIEFQDVSFAYESNVPIVQDLSFSVPPGEVVALVGPSGAGKSTIFKLLMKFFEPDSGRILINDHDLADTNVVSLRENIAYVGQQNFMFAGTIRENLALHQEDISSLDVEAACKAVALHDFISEMPLGYDTHVGELGTRLSGGQAQRLNIARAILKDPPILLLDEITSALDAANEELIRQYIFSQAGKKTTLVIAHRLSTVRDADKILLLEDGRMAASGRHQDLIAHNAHYSNMVALQFSMQ